MDPNDEIEQLRRQLDQARQDAVTREAELQRYHQQLEAANLQLRELATTDPLTGLANRRVFDVRLSVDFAGAGGGIEEDDVFFKKFGLRGDAAIGHDGEAAAVEDQRVVPSHLIDVDDRALVGARDGAEHVKTQIAFIEHVRRGREI